MARFNEEPTAMLERSWDWSAVLKGAFVALALLIVLRLFGAALGTTSGDRVLSGGFATWSVIAEIVCFGLGGALAGRLLASDRLADGALAGAFVWVVATVIDSILFGRFGPQTVASATWGAFFGTVLALGGALAGGALGVRSTRRRHAGASLGTSRAEPPAHGSLPRAEEPRAAAEPAPSDSRREPPAR